MVKKFFIVVLLMCSFTALYANQTSPQEWWIGKPIKEFIYIDLTTISPETINGITDGYIGTAYADSAIDALKAKLLASNQFLSIDIIPSRGDGDGSQVVLYIEFVETQKLTSFTFTGNKILTSAELTRTAGLKVGEIFNATAISNAIVAVKALYNSKGYDQVDVTPSYRTDVKTNGVVVTFALKEYDWWVNKPIRQFKYNGLVNVSSDTMDDITYRYLGRQFTKQLYAELESELNALLVFSVFQAEAGRGGDSNTDLVITFSFTELPQIENIYYVGNAGLKSKALEEVVPLSKGEFLSWSQVNAGTEALKALYLEKGFADAKVESSYTVENTTNKLSLTYAIAEGRQVKVAEILFEGNTNLSSSVLIKEISSKVQSLFNAGNYSSVKIAADIQTLQLAYQTRGYIDAKILDVKTEEVSLESDPIKKLRVTFVLQEGDLWRLDAITVEGNTKYSTETILGLLTMKGGSVLDIQKVQSEIGKIADLYWNEGYVENTLDIRETRDANAKTILYTLVITERAQAIVEEVLIRGLTKTKPYVFERELVLRAGDVFSKEKYINSAQNLYNTGLLTDIKPSIGYGTGENSLVVTYEVTEGNQMNVGFGATFGGNVEGFPVSGFLSWSDTNLWGTGRDLSISTELAPDSQSVSIGFSDNWVLDKRWSNALNFSFEHSSRTNGLVLGDFSPDTSDRTNQAYPYPYNSYAQWEADGFQTPSSEYLMPYEYYQLSANYSTGYTFMFDSGRLSVGFGPTFALNRAVYDTSIYTPFDYLIEQYGEGWRFSNRVGLSLSWDGRDYIKNTTRGYVVSQNLTYAGGILGGLSNYMRSSTSASGFLKIFEIPGDKPTPGVLSLNSTLSLMFDQYYKTSSGWDWNLSASKYEYLYIDGMTVGRGFEPQTYKKFMWDTSLEFSIQLVENLLWGEIFASATGVKTERSDITSLRSLDWYMASGVGIKLKIPGFPLGLYMVKNATMLSTDDFTWIGGPIFKGTSPTSGFKLVLAITTSLF